MDYAHWGLISRQGELFELGDNVGGHGAGFVHGDVDKHVRAHGDGVENVVLVLQGYPKYSIGSLVCRAREMRALKL